MLKFVWRRLLFRQFFVEKLSSGIYVSFQSFGRECFFRDFWYGFLCRDFWAVMSLHSFCVKHFIFRDCLEEIPLQIFFGRELLNHFCWDFGYGFLCRDFLVENVLQKVLGNTFSSEIVWKKIFKVHLVDIFFENFSADLFGRDSSLFGTGISWDILARVMLVVR